MNHDDPPDEPKLKIRYSAEERAATGIANEIVVLLRTTDGHDVSANFYRKLVALLRDGRK